MYFIATYNKGWEPIKEDTRKIERIEFVEFVNSDDRFDWIEDVLDDFKELQLEKFGKLMRQTAVYNFNHEAGSGYDIRFHYDDFGGAIVCIVFTKKDDFLDIIKEVANYLNCNIYHDAKCIYSTEESA